MIIPPRFYFEVQHPTLSDKAHFVLRYLNQHDATAAGIFRLSNDHRYDRFGRIALMTNLYVHPAHRACGEGKELLRYLKHWQDTTKTDVVFLVSPYPRHPHLDIWCLKNFYSEHGFPEIKGTAYHGRIHQDKRKWK